MREVHIDIETYSSADIASSGLYRYALSPDFRLLLVGYSIGDDPARVLDFGSDEEPRLPEWLSKVLLQSDGPTLHAHNATFERVCLSVQLWKEGLLPKGEFLPPERWRCSMIQAARCGLPLSLKEVGTALGLEKQKLEEGKNLIKVFCKPNKSKGALFDPDNDHARLLPEDSPEDWELFKTYCARDVEVEKEICNELSWYETTDFENELYCIDQRINDRGAMVDLELAKQAIKLGDIQVAKLSAEAQKITGLSNPNSAVQLKKWLSDQFGEEVIGLAKSDLPLLKRKAQQENRPLILRVLALREEMAKTSNAKYETMLDMVCEDNRLRGMTQFYGTRTGRWAGRGVQLQNLPQNHLSDIDFARECLKNGEFATLELCYGSPTATTSQLLRTAFIAPKGHILAVCDFSAIEARVLAWLAGEEWVLDTFRKGGDIYCATATQMFGVPVEKHGRNAELRQKGKVAVLALGYQGGQGALDRMGGQKLGMTEEEERETVTKWRAANKHIVDFWTLVENAARECIVFNTPRTVRTTHAVLLFALNEEGTMTITLPSGRVICYPEAELHFEGDWDYKGQNYGNYPVYLKKSIRPTEYVYDDGAKLRFKTMIQTTKKYDWVEIYGGKLTENITQAVARDCLAETMKRCEDEGYKVVFHIHDELVMEVPDENALWRIKDLFRITPDWAKGLPLKGDGYTTPYYFKD